MALFQRRTLLSLLAGTMLGLLISPLAWIGRNDPALINSLEPLCNKVRQSTSSSPASLSPPSPSLARVEKSNLVSNNSLSSETSKVGKTSEKEENSEPVILKSTLSSKELERVIASPSDLPAKIRPRLLSQEVAPRKLLFVGVVTAEKYLNTRALGIYNTWGKEVKDLHFFSSHSQDSGVSHLPIITLPGINDTQYPPQRKVYHMLKYMHDHFIDEFDFFMRADDDVYVKVDKLLEVLVDINPAQEIYMGCPGFGRPDDRRRIKLDENEHYCMGGPGVIFSRSALRRLAPHLDACLETVVVSYNEDVEVGRCVSKMLKLQCTWSWEITGLLWTDYKPHIIPTEEFYKSDKIKSAITLHPLKDPNLMYRAHQYTLELRLKDLMRKVRQTQESLEQITSLVPRNKSHFVQRSWLWYEITTNPSSRYEINTWEYFNSTRQFLTYEHMPVIGLPNSLKNGINNALEVLLEAMNEKEGTSGTFIPPYHLFDGFTITDHSSGVLYNLHMSMHRDKLTNPVDYVANVFLPFQGAGMVQYKLAKYVLGITVNIVVSITATTDVSGFLTVYESVVLKGPKGCVLHVAMFGENKKAVEKIDRLNRLYPNEKVRLYRIHSGEFSSTTAFTHVASKLNDDSLMVHLDANLVFTTEFLDHCRTNTFHGKQVYFPILFSFYNQELVRKYIQHAQQMLISADSGFFLRYNYQNFAIYKSDFEAIGGFNFTQQASQTTKHVNDDVKFVDKLLGTSLYIMRGLEPYLRRNYRTRNCNGLKGNSHLACLNSRADAVGSKKILGSLLVSHKILDNI